MNPAPLTLVPAPELARTCTKCGGEGPFLSDAHSWCRGCRYEANKVWADGRRPEMREWSRNWRIAHAPRILLRNAKKRAAERGLPFDLVEADIFIPTHCPVLGIELAPCSGRMHPNNPTVDRFIDALGYVRGNITVISWRANCLKRDATADELETVAAWMRAHTGEK